VIEADKEQYQERENHNDSNREAKHETDLQRRICGQHLLLDKGDNSIFDRDTVIQVSNLALVTRFCLMACTSSMYPQLSIYPPDRDTLGLLTRLKRRSVPGMNVLRH
jgi:hypothetical protein